MGIETIRRLRPGFGLDDLMLHREGGETSYLPDEFAPHTITATISPEHVCQLSFEYSINEDVGTKLHLNQATINVGKYSGKILGIKVPFQNRQDLIQKFLMTGELMETREKLLPKASYQKHYEIVRGTLKRIVNDLLTNADVIKRFSD